MVRRICAFLTMFSSTSPMALPSLTSWVLPNSICSKSGVQSIPVHWQMQSQLQWSNRQRSRRIDMYEIIVLERTLNSGTLGIDKCVDIIKDLY